MQTVHSPDWLSQVILREMTAQDLPALEWEGEYTYLRKVYAHAYHQAQRSDQSRLWVADLPGRGVIGQIFLQLLAKRSELANGVDRAHIYSFRIKPDYRGRGLGSHMLAEVDDFLRSRTFRYVTLHVSKTNHQALRLYERHGFRIIAHEAGRWTFPDDKGIWRDVVDPAWRMEKQLF